MRIEIGGEERDSVEESGGGGVCLTYRTVRMVSRNSINVIWILSGIVCFVISF